MIWAYRLLKVQRLPHHKIPRDRKVAQNSLSPLGAHPATTQHRQETPRPAAAREHGARGEDPGETHETSSSFKRASFFILKLFTLKEHRQNASANRTRYDDDRATAQGAQHADKKDRSTQTSNKLKRISICF